MNNKLKIETVGHDGSFRVTTVDGSTFRIRPGGESAIRVICEDGALSIQPEVGNAVTVVQIP